MKTVRSATSRRTRLPQRLLPFFWEFDFGQLTWKTDADLIIGRILTAGDWQSIQWLRRRLPDAALHEWILRRRGAGLSSRQLRFWELILELPHRQVNVWLRDPARLLWEGRHRA